MRGKAFQFDATNGHRWQMGICVLLAALLLYNPFIALYCSHGASSVHTPQRNRATVGASELEQFGPGPNEIQQADTNIAGSREEVAVPAGSYVARGFAREVELPQPEIALKVWSRPPPSL